MKEFIKERVSDDKPGAGNDDVKLFGTAVFEVDRLTIKALNIYCRMHLAVPNFIQQLVIDRWVGATKSCLGFLKTVGSVVAHKHAYHHIAKEAAHFYRKLGGGGSYHIRGLAKEELRNNPVTAPHTDDGSGADSTGLYRHVAGRIASPNHKYPFIFVGSRLLEVMRMQIFAGKFSRDIWATEDSSGVRCRRSGQ